MMATANTRFQREYHCTNCGLKTNRDKLTVKKAVFTEMGSKAKTFKSRAVAHLCDRPTCLPKDEDWNRPPYSEPDFKVMPEGFEDDDDEPDTEEQEDPDADLHPDGQLELPLEPVHLLGR
jgi:hypothetical protein